MEHLQYVPGVCNIGPAEIAMRKRTGWFGFALAVCLWGILTALRASAPWFFLLLIPSGISATGFIQARMHFCAAFGMRGRFNFGSEMGKTDTALQAEFRAQDKKKALQIFVYSALVGIGAALAAYILRQIGL
jgi:hypothetical protein